MSFSWDCMFRKGQWLEFRRFVLEQRRNVPDRVLVINKEIERIGEVSILYELKEGVRTERREGFFVDPSSALGKLMRAYIAQGGNPFDVSMFLQPDSYRLVEDEGTEDAEGVRRVGGFRVNETQPFGGVIYPESKEGFEGVDTSGWLPLWKYPPRKLGSNEANIFPEADEIGGQIGIVKRAFAQELSHLRANLEAKIIKLCDLREQLIIERDEVLASLLSGTTISVYDEFDPKLSLSENHLSNIVTNIDLQYHKTLNREGVPVPDFSQPILVRSPLSVYQCLLDDAPTGEEEFTTL
jgi:hypothetical protein